MQIYDGNNNSAHSSTTYLTTDSLEFCTLKYGCIYSNIKCFSEKTQSSKRGDLLLRFFVAL